MMSDLAKIALLELSRGSTAAPKGVLRELKDNGFLVFRGVPRLTTKGRTRARGLQPFEHDLRLMHAAADGAMPLRTVGGSAMQL